MVVTLFFRKGNPNSKGVAREGSSEGLGFLEFGRYEKDVGAL